MTIGGLKDLRARDGYEKWSRATDSPLLGLSLIFAVVLLLPLLADLSSYQERMVGVLNVVIWTAFAGDYLIRLYLAPRRWHFVRSHVLDLLVVALPLLRPLRALRLLRVLRAGSVAAIAHQRASRSLHARVSAYVLSAVAIALVLAAVGVREAERRSTDANIKTLEDGLWWAASTVTTVGYGDRYPTTTLGRLIALGLMLFGIALLGVVTASVAAWFVARLNEVRESVGEVEEQAEASIAEVLIELREVRARLDQLVEQHGSP